LLLFRAADSIRRHAQPQRQLPGNTASPPATRDGGHGLLAWAVASLLTILLTLWSAQIITPLAAPGGGTAGPATSVAGENIIAYDVDRLLRTEKRPAPFDPDVVRAEVSRILLTSAGHDGVRADDRVYLNRLVSSLTGLDTPAAEQRVNAVIAEARTNIQRARRSAVILAFMSGVAVLIGGVAAWFAACVGGRHRDSGKAPSLAWGLRGPRTVGPSNPKAS
jgi:hypothetical protein